MDSAIQLLNNWGLVSKLKDHGRQEINMFATRCGSCDNLQEINFSRNVDLLKS